MKAKKYYRVEIAEKKINSDGKIESGDTINSAIFKTLSQAKAYGMKALKKENVYSVWINYYNESITNDFISQWSRYSHYNNWNEYHQY